MQHFEELDERTSQTKTRMGRWAYESRDHYQNRSNVLKCFYFYLTLLKLADQQGIGNVRRTLALFCLSYGYYGYSQLIWQFTFSDPLTFNYESI